MAPTAMDGNIVPATPLPPPAADAAMDSAPPSQPQVTRKRLAGAYGQCGALIQLLGGDTRQQFNGKNDFLSYHHAM